MTKRDRWIVLGLVPVGYLLATNLQSLVYAQRLSVMPADVSSWIEVLGFITGLQYVFLIIRQNLWAWAFGLVNAGIYAYFFFEVAKHFANSMLQFVYMVAMIHGWWAWRRSGGEDKRAVRSLKKEGLALGSAFVVLFTLAWTPVLQRYQGQIPFWDALTTGLSLLAQWWTNLKFLQNWHVWILVNAIYVPLYVYRGYHPTAALYFAFLVMAVIGLMEWRKYGA